MVKEISNRVAVILAGGSGTRLWPLSRQQLPKQFLNLKGEETLLDGTISRLSPLVSRDDVWVITSEAHATGEAFNALKDLNTILEPVARNTAPAVAVAAALLMDISESDPVMLVLPADHLIQNRENFHQCLQIAFEAAEDDQLITFGIEPTRPDTGFGYIQADSDESKNVHPVVRFTEKPDLATAESFLSEGGYYWNSGMFVWKASVILSEVRNHLPDLWSVLEVMREKWNQGEAWQEVIRHGFPGCHPSQLITVSWRSRIVLCWFPVILAGLMSGAGMPFMKFLIMMIVVIPCQETYLISIAGIH